MTVSEFCPRNVRGCPRHATIAEAGETLLTAGFDSLPVMDDEDFVLGMISVDRIRGALAQVGQAARRLPVELAMDPEVVTCHPTDDVRDLLPVLEILGATRLPVVDSGGRLLGVLSIEDLFYRILIEAPRPDLPAALLLKTFSRVTRRDSPRPRTPVPLRRSLSVPGDQKRHAGVRGRSA
ncbi:MAG TPA: CBS domain-containing protein [Planctomycetota bacterium]|nr:CBS domain-containing protein [Planctomycetota bacterium]